MGTPQTGFSVLAITFLLFLDGRVTINARLLACRVMTLVTRGEGCLRISPSGGFVVV